MKFDRYPIEVLDEELALVARNSQLPIDIVVLIAAKAAREDSLRAINSWSYNTNLSDLVDELFESYEEAADEADDPGDLYTFEAYILEEYLGG